MSAVCDYRITERLGHLASNKSLWKTVDFRPHKLTSSQLSKYVNYFKESTKFLAVRGFASEAANLKQGDGVLAPKLLELIFKKCPELETLILDEHFGPACMVSSFCKRGKDIDSCILTEYNILWLLTLMNFGLMVCGLVLYITLWFLTGVLSSLSFPCIINALNKAPYAVV
jgi:hypothetical protein